MTKIASASPQGSKFREIARQLALRFLTDSQRKRVKGVVHGLRSVPLRLLGVEQMVASQQAEIERLKSRLIILDGKFNVALYGIPDNHETRELVAGNPLVKELAAVSLPAHRIAPPRFDDLKGLSPASILVFGGETASAVLEALPSVREAVLCDRDADSTARLLSPSGSIVVTPLATDPLSALLALRGRRFDVITIGDAYCHLTALEQYHFLKECGALLSAGGTLYLSLPNLQNTAIAQDRYWTDPRCVRPYSVHALVHLLGQERGKVSLLGSAQDLRLGALFRKD